MAPPIKDVSVQEFATQRGVTAQRVYQWIQEGLPHRKRKSSTRIVSAEAHKWLEARAEERGRADREDDDAKTRKLAAEADLKEFEVAERRRRLIPADEFNDFIENFVGGFAAVASGQLQRFERDMVRATTAGDARVITQKQHAALMEGARQYATQMETEAEELERDPEKPAA